MYRPLYTSTYVLSELATLILSHRAHAAATAAVERVRNSPTIVVHPVEEDFDATCEQFADYQGEEISFTDHMSGVLADERAIDHLFTFDADHFRTLGFTVVRGIPTTPNGGSIVARGKPIGDGRHRDDQANRRRRYP